MSQIQSVYNEILESGEFLSDWYLDTYRDVAASGTDPLEHYLLYGVSEGRDPGPHFSTSGYLSRYRDVADAEINPLLHYLRYGRKEGRITTPCHDPALIRRPYGGFSGFLVHAILSPLVNAPFSRIDLENFRLMDAMAGWLGLKQEASRWSPLVSVVMPMRDRAKVVGEAIQSVLTQSYGNFELIAVDDGSCDGSPSVARGFNDSRIRVFETDRSLGVSAARNRGIAGAGGELIAYLDSDNTWRPDYLRAMVGAFYTLPDADALYGGQYLYRGLELEPFAVRFGGYNPSLLRNRNYIDLNCFVHRRRVLDTIGGGFCEDIKRWVDWEMILRISRAGKIYSVPILQSNYYLEKVDNAISDIESLEPARKFIMAKWGYGAHVEQISGKERLARKVALIVTKDGSASDEGTDFRKVENGKLTSLYVDPDVSVSEAVALTEPDSDLVIMDVKARLCKGALGAMQEAAYAEDEIGIVVPQHVLPGGAADTNFHVPYAFCDAPCDVSLSHRHRNIDSVPMYHDGGSLVLKYAPFFCVYIKRDVWDSMNGLGLQQGWGADSDRIMCEFVRHILGKEIIYTPDAMVLHKES